jgi:WD40 repeat protein
VITTQMRPPHLFSGVLPTDGYFLVPYRHVYPQVASSITSMYTLVGSLNGHTDSITAAQFSPDKAYLASGSEDGSLLVHSISNWEPLLRFVDASSITSLVWHPTSRRLLFCGCKSGDVHIIRFSASGVRSRILQHQISVLTNIQNPARCSYVDRRNAGPNPVPGAPYEKEFTCCWMRQ